MRINHYLLLIILILLLILIKGDEKVESPKKVKIEEKGENRQEEKKEELSDELPGIKETKKKRRIFDLDFSNEDKKRESHTIALTSSNFDSIIQNGIHNRWLIIFYAETSLFSKKAKSIIDKVIEEKKYKTINNIKFASVDLDYNYRLQIRFNITGIPRIFLVENNKMLEIPNFPIEDNFIKSIEIESIETHKSVRNLNPEISLYEFIKRLIDAAFSQVTIGINRFAKKHKINYEFNKYSVFLIILLFFCFMVSIFFLIIDIYFYNNKEVTKKDRKNSKENKTDEIKEEKNIVNNNDESEEMKIIIEEKKVEEMKEKLNEEKENNNKEGEIKNKEKKKKKE